MLLLQLIATTAQINCCLPEQTALNYFTDNILKTDYQNNRSIYFPGKLQATQPNWNVFTQRQCVDGYSSILQQSMPDTSTTCPLLIFYSTVFKKVRRPKVLALSLYVYKALKIDDAYYTCITVYKANHFVKYYLIKTSIVTNKTAEICRASEII